MHRRMRTFEAGQARGLCGRVLLQRSVRRRLALRVLAHLGRPPRRRLRGRARLRLRRFRNLRLHACGPDQSLPISAIMPLPQLAAVLGSMEATAARLPAHEGSDRGTAVHCG